MVLLDDFAARIDRIAQGPDAVEGSRLVRLARPLLTAVGYAPRVRLDRTRALLTTLADEATSDDTAAETALREALRELADNITAVERAVLLNRRPMVAHAAWLGRLRATLSRAARVLESPGDRCARRRHPVRLEYQRHRCLPGPLPRSGARRTQDLPREFDVQRT